MIADYPETPEGVALFLLTLILDRDTRPTREQVLSLYRDCLAATRARNRDCERVH